MHEGGWDLISDSCMFIDYQTTEMTVQGHIPYIEISVLVNISSVALPTEQQSQLSVIHMDITLVL